MEKKTPKVFISYSWAVKEKIVNLAQRLVNDGVDVKVDFWDLKEGNDKHRFMESMVNDETIDFVLIVCDKTYTEKADGRKGGVGEETEIISSELYGQSDQTKFVPLILEKDDEGNAIRPVYIKSRIYFDFSDDDNYENEYEKLLRHIYKDPLIPKPKLGEKPKWLNNVTSISLLKSMTSVLNSTQNETRKNAAIIDFSQEFVKKVKEITIDDSNRSIDVLGKGYESIIDSMKPLRDAYLDFLKEVILSEKDAVSFICDFMERVYNELMLPPEGKNGWYKTFFEPYQFLIWETFVCSIAYLRYYKKYKDIYNVLTHTFFLIVDHSPSRNAEPTTFLTFRCYLSFFDGEYGRQMQKRSLSADTAVKRIKEPIITKNSFADTDIFLTQMSFALGIAKNGYYWFALSYLYSDNPENMWNRLQSRAFCKEILPMFGVKTIEELGKILHERPVSSKYGYNEEWYGIPPILSNSLIAKFAQLP